MTTYDYSINDNERVYKSVRLVNHKIYDPAKESQRYYFYSLNLLFVPFQNESDLLLPKETVEEVFSRLLPNNPNFFPKYHETLQKMLKAHYNVKKVNKARNNDVEV